MSRCTTFNAHVVDQVVTLFNLPLIAAGGVGEVQVRCTFCDKWDGSGKVAVFYREGGDVYHVLVVGGVVTVPHEVLAEPGFFYMGFMGQADIVRTSEVIRVEVREGAITVPTATTKEPTPDIYQQMLEAHGILEARFNEAVAMRAGSGSLNYHAEDDPVEVDITSNGAVASVRVSLHNISNYAPQGGATYESGYCIPPAFAPMSLVELTDAGMGTNYLAVVIDPGLANEEGWCKVEVTWGWDGDELAALETYEATYDLAAVHVDEVADIRVGYNGVTHPTAGDAVRNQVAALVSACSAPFVETGTTVRCDPFMVGEPLTITSPALETHGSITVTRAGENPLHAAESFTLYGKDIRPDIRVDFEQINNDYESRGIPLRMRDAGDGKIMVTKTAWAGPLPNGYAISLHSHNDPPIVLSPNNKYVLRGCPPANGQTVVGGYVSADVCKIALSGKDAEGNHLSFFDRGNGVELKGLVQITTMSFNIGEDYGTISSDLIFEPRVEPTIKTIPAVEGTNVLTVVDPEGAVMTVSCLQAAAPGTPKDVVVDHSFDETSDNPIANHVVTAAVKQLQDADASLKQGVDANAATAQQLRQDVNANAAAILQLQAEAGDTSALVYVTPQMYGAVADGVTNDSAAFKAMIDGNPDGSVFFIPAGTYAVDLLANERHDYWYSPLDVYKRNHLTFIFAKGAKLVAMTDNINYTAYCCLFNITRSDSIKVVGGEFVGWREAWDLDHENGGNKRQAGIEINCSTNIWIDGVDAHDNTAGGLGIAGANPSTDGGEATYSEDILVQNSRFHADYYHGIFIEGGKNVVLENVSAWGATVTNYACSIDIEGLQDSFGNVHYNENIVCRGCFFGKSRGQSVSLHKTKGATLVNCRIEGLGKEDNVINASGNIVRNGLNINTGEDYLVDTCDINGSIMQDSKPAFKNAIIQNCVIKGPFALDNQNDASCYCEWTFQNNTIFLDPVAWESNGVVMYLSKGTNTVRFVNNVFNVLSSPASNTRCFWVTGDVVFTNNVFNIGAPDNLVAINNFWQVAGDVGRFVLEGNEFNTFCTTSDPGYLIYGVKTVPMYVVNNIFREKGPTFAPAAFTSPGTIICTGNTFLLNARTYAVYDANAPANLYAHNTFCGNAAVSLVHGSAVSETTNAIKQILL